LNRFDVVSSETAEDALNSVFVTRPDLIKSIPFVSQSPSDPEAVKHEAARQEEYWENMTTERAFLARVFVDYCVKNKDEATIDKSLPTVSTLALRIQTEYNKLEETFVDGDEDEMTERSFIVGELMRLAVNMDYTDQFGRSTMLQHTRTSLSVQSLSADVCSGDDLPTKFTVHIGRPVYGYPVQDRK
jgi:condensin complex subunit 3